MLSRLLTIREQVILAAIPAAVVIGALALWLVSASTPDAPPGPLPPPEPAPAPAPAPPAEPVPEPAPEPEPAAPPEPPEPRQIGVAVRGGVERPGLYYLEEGQRVEDLLDEAGGVTPDADLSDINISAYLQDASTLTIPIRPAEEGPALHRRQREPVINPPQYTISGWSPVAGPPGAPASAPGAAPAAADGGLVDINSADARALEVLPGIGPVLAERIVAARAQGRFTSVDDLTRVSGIGTKTLASLRPLICAR